MTLHDLHSNVTLPHIISNRITLAMKRQINRNHKGHNHRVYIGLVFISLLVSILEREHLDGRGNNLQKGKNKRLKWNFSTFTFFLFFSFSFLALIKDECPHNSAREKDGRNSFLNGRWDGERKASLNPNIESMERYYSHVSCVWKVIFSILWTTI